jgi:hypothetical protein
MVLDMVGSKQSSIEKTREPCWEMLAGVLLSDALS